jgi:predicted XRE-type DNA-binding protein
MCRSKKEDFHLTEGNIFEDLGLENSDELLACSKLLLEIGRLIKASKLSQKEIAAMLDITQPLEAFKVKTLIT